MSSTTERFGLGVAVALGALVRALPVIGAGSVVGDGGLFLSMVDDIRAAGLVLPVTTSYNGLDIPFVYPPAGLLGAAALGELLNVDTLDLLRWVPLALSTLCLIAFAWLAQRALAPIAAVGATLAYALMPSAYGWLVAGGGLTRGLGLLMALIAVALVSDRSGRPASLRVAVAAGLFLGLSGLSHPQAAVFGLLGCLVLSWRSSTSGWLVRVGVAAATTVVVVLPWLAWLASVDGIGAFIGAGGRGEPLVGIVRMLNLRFSAAPFMDVVGVAGVVGVGVCIARRSFRLPLLLVLTYLAGAGGGEFLAAAPWALIAGIGMGELARLLGDAMATASTPSRRATAAAIAIIALFLALIGSVGSRADPSSKLNPLGADRITALGWVSQNTPPDAQLIVPTDQVWGYDNIGEWLPALARRHSVGTVQGSEWLGANGFAAQLEDHDAIVDCAGATAACYAAIDPDATLFVPKGALQGLFSPDDCCPALRATLAAEGYEIVYDGPGATIARPGS